MNWESIISNRRTGDQEPTSDYTRTDYQRDFDRIIFSSGFRRLQNKTQVFPLPGITFVHNRLTHSLEVASIGRSLGKEVGKILSASSLLGNCSEAIREFYVHELQNVIASACLAHDIGNPAFGHSGEKAISLFFLNNRDMKLNGKALADYFNEDQWHDLTNFEGNANGLRILTHRFQGKSPGGLLLTYTTLAALIKYPCESVAIDKKHTHRKKYGFFQTEKTLFRTIFDSMEIPLESESPVVYARHPFVYLTEAADDICYRIIDFEDAHRLGIISTEDVETCFMDIAGNLDPNEVDKMNRRRRHIEDKNERLAYLRAKCMNFLSNYSIRIFESHLEELIAGKFKGSILDSIRKECSAFETLEKISFEKIYHHRSVLEIEIAGEQVMQRLLELFIPQAIDVSDKTAYKTTFLIPTQFRTESTDVYERVMALLDYISGMTDPFATELYRRVSGIEISRHV